MKSMRQKFVTKFILITLILTSILLFPGHNNIIDMTNEEGMVKQAGDWNLSPIVIDDTGSGDYTWAQAVLEDWCSGSGTLNNPYIIENVTIDGQKLSTCLTIQNSNVHFKIQNCNFKNSSIGGPNSGIRLINASNGKILGNNNTNSPNGIILDDCTYIIIEDNNFLDLNAYGINVLYSNFIQITENFINLSAYGGINLIHSNYSSVKNNTVQYCSVYGINIGESSHNTITNNIASNHSLGVGINVQDHSFNNSVSQNILMMNYYGASIENVNSKRNVFYKNYFMNNTQHASDNGVQNHWNGTNIGNYWENYTGSDLNLDGVGDITYSFIGGSAGTEDFLPIYGDPFHNGSKIYIDGELNTGYNSWQWISTRAFCSGTGVEGDPYVLANLYIDIDGGWGERCIRITNTHFYFEVISCRLNSSNSVGLFLENCSNGKIYNNILWHHSDGIVLDHCNNLLLSNNKISESNYGIHAYNGSINTICFNILSECGFGVYLDGNTSYNFIHYNNQFLNNNAGVYLFGKAHELYNNTFQNCGIIVGWVREETISYKIDTSNTLNDRPIYYYANKTNLSSTNFVDAGQILLANCNDSIISDLTFSQTGLPIMMVYSDNNEISNISINDEVYGIGIAACDNNTIKNNEIEECGIGIWLLSYCDNNNFNGNKFINNSHAGVKLGMDTNNTFNNNLFKDNQDYGIYLMSWSEGNLIHKNIFVNNTEHAFDETDANFWDNGVLGNFWDDYTGVDLNGDGIGDSPYDVSGSFPNQDRYPLMTIPAPEITINSPIPNQIIGSTAPSYDISITGFYDSIWYTLDGGINYTVSGLTGTINQGAWTALADGLITITFFVNNFAGMEGSAQVMVIKENSEEPPPTPPGIPGYDLYILIGALSVISALIIRKRVKS